MSITYSTAVKTARLNSVVTQMGSTAVLEIGTAGMAAVIASFTLDTTPATVSGAVMTFAGFPKTATATSGGTAAAARIRTATGGTDLITGLTCGTSGTDVVLDNASIANGQAVTLTGVSITHS